MHTRRLLLIVLEAGHLGSGDGRVGVLGSLPPGRADTASLPGRHAVFPLCAPTLVSPLPTGISVTLN